MPLMLYDRVVAYARATLLLSVGFYGLVVVLLEILTLKDVPDLFNLEKLSDRIFGKVWVIIAPLIKKTEDEGPLPKLMQRAYGTVIEIGPGSGNQLSRYDASKVTRLYGVEPNFALHKTLRKTAEDLGLGDRFTIVPHGIEDFDKLREYGIDEDSADTVMSVSVLCSVPNPQSMTKAMYRLLKPGGQVIVHEHVASEDMVTSFVQTLFQIPWPHLFGGCSLIRPTARYLQAAGQWEKSELEPQNATDAACSVVPKVVGRMVKAGKGDGS